MDLPNNIISLEQYKARSLPPPRCPDFVRLGARGGPSGLRESQPWVEDSYYHEVFCELIKHQERRRRLAIGAMIVLLMAVVLLLVVFCQFTSTSLAALI